MKLIRFSAFLKKIYIYIKKFKKNTVDTVIKCYFPYSLLHCSQCTFYHIRQTKFLALNLLYRFLTNKDMIPNHFSLSDSLFHNMAWLFYSALTQKGFFYPVLERVQGKDAAFLGPHCSL